jgi:hypothetical protein
MLGFAGAFRKSEVVALNVEDLEFCDEGVRATIRRSKTDQEGKGQTIAILRGTGSFCPVRLLREWLDVAGVINLRVRCSVEPDAGNTRFYYVIIRPAIQPTADALAALRHLPSNFGSH